MRALRFHGNRDIRVDEIPEPALRPGWVKVKNAWCGICGSDLHEYLVGPTNAPTVPHVLTGETIPTVLGHEFAGTIVAVADDVTDLEIGQKVAVFPVITDGSCYYCQKEVLGMCEKWGFLGYSGYGGGMAEYVCVERRAVHKIPENMPLDVAALVEPLAVAWHGVKLAEIGQDDLALVLGAGPIGIAVVLCLRAQGVKNIVVSEVSAIRRSHAEVAGATHLVNPTNENVSAIVRGLGDKRGAHVVYECAGVQASMDAAVMAVRGKGTIVGIAIYESPIQFQPNLLNRKSVTMVNSSIYTRDEFQEVIDAIASGQLKSPEAMITARVPLERSVDDAFGALLQSKDKHVKILVSPEL